MPPHPGPKIPPALQSQVFLDFDGTITRKDLLDELIQRFSIDDSWQQLERLWQIGEIGSRQCLEGQFAVIRIEDADLNALLDEIEVDPGLHELLNFLEERRIPWAIVSDGVDIFIKRILAGQGINAIVRCNAIQRAGLAMQLKCPLNSADCLTAAAHCKCASMTKLAESPRQSIYVGDGRSDLCPSRTSHTVFAKGAPAAALKSENRAFIAFTTLSDVKRELESTMGDLEKISHAIAARQAGMIDLLSSVVAIPSVSGRERAMTEFVASWAKRQGFEIDLWQADETEVARVAPLPPKFIPLADRPTLVIRHAGSGEAGARTLLFNAHADVVAAPNAEKWRFGPWSGRLHDNQLFGRGACDTKGPLVSALWAMAALRDAQIALPGDVLLELIPGEEDCVGLGTLTSVARGWRADGVVVLEPTQGIPRCASRGGLRFEITCTGTSVHGSVKWLGKDAIELLPGLFESLKRLEKQWDDRSADPLFADWPISRPITVDTIRAGQWQGMICDECVCGGYLELLPGDDLNEWKKKFSDALTADRVEVEFVESYLGHRTSPDNPLCRAAGEQKWSAFNSGCEAGLRANLLGTPTLVWGPGDLAHAHAVDERVNLSEVAEAAEKMALLAIRFASAE